ncbi:MAG TPA: APC family permease, partial [Pyrinomonadaceae bacterium]|nr:APC family permease [Pyrinomonadaceae bacterium]
MNTEPTTTSPTVTELERDVEARSAVFKKELGLFDLVLTQVVFVVGTFWVGWAARLGSQQSAFWILAILTFYVPLAVAVIFLNRLMPYEGGLYQWSKLAFNDFVAFMVGWNLWVFAITILAGTGLVVTTNLSYAIGPTAAWIKDSMSMNMLISFFLVGAMVIAAMRGLALGKWVHNVGGVVHMITFAVLIFLPLFALSRALGGPYEPFSVQLPTFSEYNVNVGSKLALGALTGFEYIAIAAGETRSPARNIARSVVISAPIIALMFILGTSSVIAFIPRDHIDVIGPIPQVLSIGFGSLGWVGAVGSIA